MKAATYVLIVLLFSSCYAGRHEYEGVYHKSYKAGAEYTITLKANDSFDYNWHYCLADGKVSGRYKKQHGHIILNGGTPPPQKIIVTENLIKNPDSVYIKVVGLKDLPVFYAVVSVDSVNRVTNTDGDITIKRNEVKKIKIKYLNLDGEYLVNNKKSNYFLLKINSDFNNDFYFKDEKAKVKRNKLIIKNTKKIRPKKFKKLDPHWRESVVKPSANADSCQH